MKFYRCEKCGNIITFINDAGVTPVCCGETMKELKANSVDATKEKHVPHVEIDGNKVNIQVGSDLHPMTNEHYITTIVLETNKKTYIKHLLPTEAPVVCFNLCDKEIPRVVYEYCNIHGLWENCFDEEQGC